ncbi:ATP12 family chaperone protein [Phaeobacter inhibens]|uniref:Chaperone required for the assembly of the F1-ATPase n=1 Tax=Phaeobacter inhibens TaxID=221822 RepID=A0ABN5GGQ1_9RHOB|nr:ATP12 family protein [Phaeobacter inhibens]AUQ48555.1 Chaperone required for the assembly of the F1-ATPase [Phaeobacter inhibens]AUQ63912.1 Chaperone required for the assembly of the F1-ATPase [Phaeobacter inhibens]AUQ83816.1 Chaperone required for the assembly of the F1-ATPase [Phaeobacter inhibens]AUQ91624.1 Chaperone required for the assembly of the F1-ATPase [Phaeobacter inhibens]AUQ93055.1 Chaperone required for the assembly of the F1-ATPase [Phaeobacter inhibens]
MSEWKQKRFWKAVSVAETEDGFAVELDGRRVKTPAKAALAVPGREMAEAIAAEWDAQTESVNPNTMPVTRSANAAIDKVTHQHAAVADMLAEYGDSDLLCYRAEMPVELVQRQAEIWDPALDWAAKTLGARLEPRSGILHAPQNPEALAHLRRLVHEMTPFQLAAFHDLVAMSGSLVLGFAATRSWRPADQIWEMSRLDELWQEQQWGQDEDAQATADLKRAAFLHAKRFYDFSC